MVSEIHDDVLKNHIAILGKTEAGKSSTSKLAVEQVCHYITQRLAGRGAAREVIELILKAQGRWEDAVPLASA
jgi:3-deoxy-D-manno-octulosonate 8-phosphate phosphatase KdsC-like HAD superfamily phosphatase